MAMTLNTVNTNTCAHMGIYCIICVERNVAKNTWRKYLPIENCENSSYSVWDLSATRREQSWTIMIIWLRRHLLPEQWPRAEPVNSYARQSPARVRVAVSILAREAGQGLFVIVALPADRSRELPSAGTRQGNDIFNHWQWPSVATQGQQRISI